MEFKRCSRGHYYDPNVTDTCPQCAAEAQALQGYGQEEAGETVPVGMVGMDDDNATQPIYSGVYGMGQTDMVSDGDATEPFDKFNTSVFSNERGAEEYSDVTQPMEMVEGLVGFTPVTGWLVCVDGPAKGTDYRVRGGYNYIGRAGNMDICIAGDNKIGRERHAMIAYDSEEKVFFFGPSDGKSIVRLNGKMVMVPTEIHDHDVIAIGATKLMFVPLCGERFNWDA